MLGEAAWSVAQTPGPLRAFFERIRARKGPQVAATATARRLAAPFWCLLRREQDYAFERPSLTRSKLRQLELAAGAPPRTGVRGIAGNKSAAVRETERELARRAEAAYRRMISDWQATAPAKTGAGATPGRASQRPSKGKAARQARSPRHLHFAPSVTRTQPHSRKGAPNRPADLTFIRRSRASGCPAVWRARRPSRARRPTRCSCPDARAGRAARMARPGLEPGTPRFSVVRSATPGTAKPLESSQFAAECRQARVDLVSMRSDVRARRPQVFGDLVWLAPRSSRSSAPKARPDSDGTLDRAVARLALGHERLAVPAHQPARARRDPVRAAAAPDPGEQRTCPRPACRSKLVPSGRELGASGDARYSLEAVAEIRRHARGSR